MNIRQLLDAAKLVMQGESSDEKRASMRLVKTSQWLAQAELISLFEECQKDLIKELYRLKTKDLVSFHTEAALARVSRLLGKMRRNSENVAINLVNSNILSGKIGERLKAGKDPATAFSLSQGDETRAQRLVDQLLGHISHAAACAEQFIRSKVAAASVRATMPKDYEETAAEDANIPTIEHGAQTTFQSTKQAAERGLPNTTVKQLKEDPLAASLKLQFLAEAEGKRLKEKYVLGRREVDTIRKETLYSVAKSEVKGSSLVKAKDDLMKSLTTEGITAFQDRGGRKWTLGNYCNMAVRTTTRQSSNLGLLFEDEEHDLYKIIPRGSNCPICAKYEGRVYSRSGKDPNYPPLSKAFGKIDPNGPDTLENTYLNIHPNCRHVLAKWHERAYSPEEVEEMRRKSNPEITPFELDQRTKEGIKAYKERERVHALRNKILRLYREMYEYFPEIKKMPFPKFEKGYKGNAPWFVAYQNKFKALRKGG